MPRICPGVYLIQPLGFVTRQWAYIEVYDPETEARFYRFSDYAGQEVFCSPQQAWAMLVQYDQATENWHEHGCWPTRISL
jgi:hypothetical protein